MTFGNLDSDDDMYQYDSSEFNYIGFDELPSFTFDEMTSFTERHSPSKLAEKIRTGRGA
jgi:hypothetical protein